MASTGHALIRKHFRRRFGVSAQQVAIRPQAPWYLRALAWSLILGAALAMAAWMYDAGRRFAGFNQDRFGTELETLREQSVADAKELAALRTAVGTAEGQLLVERATVERLSSQLAALQRDNAALKEELAFFEGLASGARMTSGSPAITRATVSVDGDGRARYRLLISNPASGRKGESLQGELQFELKTSGVGGDATMVVPTRPAERTPQYQVSVKHFARLEGEFRLPNGVRLVSGEVRFLHGTQILARRPLVLEP